MTKQQAISLKLAQWLGKENVATDSFGLSNIVMADGGVFSPFCDSTEGRAQYAACSIKAARERLRAQALKGNTDEELVAEKLEAIYYAIGGTAEEWSHSNVVNKDDPNHWIEWSGSRIPPLIGPGLFDIRKRDGSIVTDKLLSHGNLDWTHRLCDSDIVAYRVHSGK